MNEELGFSYDLLNDSYAAASSALTIGAVLLIPFALKYGRRPIYVISCALQFAICIWSAKMQTVADLMLTNILNCGLGALSEVVVQMTVADMIYVHQRGVYNSIYIFMCNFGGNMAPVAAGYVAAAEGWRWVWWWTAIFMGATFLGFTFFYEETKFSAPAVQVHDDLRLTHTGNDEESKKPFPEAVKEVPGDGVITTESASAYIDLTIPKKSTWERLALWTSTPGSLLDFSRHMWQPFPILFTFPGVFYMSLLSGILTAASAIIITTLSDYMTLPPYNFDSSQIGLMSVAPYIGNTIGSLICGPVSDWIIVLLAKRNKGVYEPEMRLWVLVAFIPLIPAGIFMFGMGLYFQAPWPLLAVGYGVYAVGTAPMSSVALTYVVDSYTEVPCSPVRLTLQIYSRLTRVFL
jgi:MFS family permease